MDPAAQEKCDKITEFLQKRESDRQKNIQIKQDIKNSSNAEHEKIDYFAKTFAEKQNEIKLDLATSNNISKSDLPSHFDNISKKILILQKYVAASNIFLRTYDIKVYHQILDDLTLQSKALEDKLIPKKKFGFKNRKTSKPVKELKNGKDEQDSLKTKQIFNYDDQYCGFQNCIGEKLFLEPDVMFKKDVYLQNLEKCKIELHGSPSTLHITNLKNCILLCGPISTSIFAENCSNCKFVIACQQLRLHSSKNIHIYLHVTSRAIMEDCSSILFAPYNLQYTEMEDDFKKSGLDISANNWLAIDDFNWLTMEEKSPNWNELNENLRIQNWDNVSVDSF